MGLSSAVPQRKEKGELWPSSSPPHPKDPRRNKGGMRERKGGKIERNDASPREEKKEKRGKWKRG